MIVYLLYVNYGSDDSSGMDNMVGVFESFAKAEAYYQATYPERYHWYVEAEQVQ
jgi:hypothetical protein